MEDPADALLGRKIMWHRCSNCTYRQELVDLIIPGIVAPLGHVELVWVADGHNEEEERKMKHERYDGCELVGIVVDEVEEVPTFFELR